jgi:hypothetical protein
VLAAHTLQSHGREMGLYSSYGATEVFRVPRYVPRLTCPKLRCPERAIHAQNEPTEGFLRQPPRNPRLEGNFLLRGASPPRHTPQRARSPLSSCREASCQGHQRRGRLSNHRRGLEKGKCSVGCLSFGSCRTHPLEGSSMTLRTRCAL